MNQAGLTMGAREVEKQAHARSEATGGAPAAAIELSDGTVITGKTGPLLAPDAILVAGTDSALLTGRKAQLLAWKREFAAPVRMIYTRTPDIIRVSDVEPIALEQGRWEGIIADKDGARASGLYSAKWRMIGSDWMIEAEIYVTFA